MNCPTCAREVDPGDNFCRACGQRLAAPASSAPPPAPDEAAPSSSFYVTRISGVVGILMMVAAVLVAVFSFRGIGVVPPAWIVAAVLFLSGGLLWVSHRFLR